MLIILNVIEETVVNHVHLIDINKVLTMVRIGTCLMNCDSMMLGKAVCKVVKLSKQLK